MKYLEELQLGSLRGKLLIKADGGKAEKVTMNNEHFEKDAIYCE